MSHLLEYSLPSKSYGDIYKGVPAWALNTYFGGILAARPKSATL